MRRTPKTSKTSNIFISHSWTHSKDYDGLVNLLDKAPNFKYKNYSVPKDNPIHHENSDIKLRQAIKRQMKPASSVLILTGVYATNSKWINNELELAKSMNKKIIAIDKRGAERTSTVAHNAADKEVKWNTGSIINAIKDKKLQKRKK